MYFLMWLLGYVVLLTWKWLCLTGLSESWENWQKVAKTAGKSEGWRRGHDVSNVDKTCDVSDFIHTYCGTDHGMT